MRDDEQRPREKDPTGRVVAGRQGRKGDHRPMASGSLWLVPLPSPRLGTSSVCSCMRLVSAMSTVPSEHPETNLALPAPSKPLPIVPRVSSCPFSVCSHLAEVVTLSRQASSLCRPSCCGSSEDSPGPSGPQESRAWGCHL